MKNSTTIQQGQGIPVILEYQNTRGRDMMIFTDKLITTTSEMFQVARKGGGFSFWKQEGKILFHDVTTSKGTRKMYVGEILKETCIHEISTPDTEQMMSNIYKLRYEKIVDGLYESQRNTEEELAREGFDVDCASMIFELAADTVERIPFVSNYLMAGGVTDVVGQLADDIFNGV